MAEVEDLVPSDIQVSGTLVWDLAFHPTADVVALGCISGALQIHGYKVNETEMLFNAQLHKDGLRAMQFTPDGAQLYTCSSDLTLKAVDCATKKITFDKRDTGHTEAINALHFLSDQLFVTGCDGGIVSLWDRRQLAPAMRWTDLAGMGVHCFTQHTDKGHILAGADDGSIAIFSMRKAEAEVLTAGNDDAVMSLAMINNDTQVAAGCAGGHIRIWKYGVWDKCCDNLKGHPSEVEGIIGVREGDVISASCDGVVRAVRLTPQPRLLDTLGYIEDAMCMRLKRSRCGGFVGVAGGETVAFFDIRKYLTAEADANAAAGAGAAFLRPATDADNAVPMEDDDDDDDDDDEDDEDGDGNDESMDDDDDEKDDSKSKHKRGKHRVDFNREGKKKQQQNFFSGL